MGQFGFERYGSAGPVVEPARRQRHRTGAGDLRPRGWPSTAVGIGLRAVELGEQVVELDHRAGPTPTRPADRRPTAKPFRYQATCLRKSGTPRCSPAQSTSSSACRRMVTRTWARVGRARSGRPSKAAARSANNHGRPRQPRPMTTPAQPVCAHHPHRVVGLPDVAVAEHRDVEQRGQFGDRLPVGLAAVEVGRGPSVQRHVGNAGILGPQRGRRGRSGDRGRCRGAS